MGVGDAPEWKKTKMLRHKGGLDRRLPVTMAPTLVYRIGPFLKAQMVRQYQAAEKAINAPLLFVIALSLTFLVLPREQLQVPGRMQLRLYYVVRTQELHNTLDRSCNRNTVRSRLARNSTDRSRVQRSAPCAPRRRRCCRPFVLEFVSSCHFYRYPWYR